MWNIAICDDQPQSIEYVKDRLENMNLPDISRISTFSDGKAMVDALKRGTLNANIFILDIDLGDCNGINLADIILDLRPDCQIIFMSGYTDYYEAVYDVNHIYFMQKPVCDEILTKAVLKAVEKLDSASVEFFIVENKSGTHIIPYTDIFTFERDKRKINITGRDGILLGSFYGRLNDIAPELPKYFHCCHNSIFLNFSKVKALEGGGFVMRDGRTVAISRSHRSESQLAFARYLTGQ